MKECGKCWGTGQVIDHKRLGREVRRRRLRAGVSLKAAAINLGISSAFLSYLESGKRAWTPELYRKASQ